MKIKELPIDERPYEKLKNIGVKNLTDEDLIAILLKTGTKEFSTKELAIKVSNMLNGIWNYNNLSLAKLKSIKGIGEIKAITLLAGIELGRRTITKKKKDINLKIDNPDIIFEMLKYDLEKEMQEKLLLILLDNKKKIISIKTVFIGTLNQSTVHQRDIFREAIKNSASSIILVHNHPSGDVIPSLQDKIFTSDIKKIGDLMKIPLNDHIIIGKDTYFSFYSEKLL